MVVGFALLFAAGIFQGSFGLGYKNYKPFSWAAFWGDILSAVYGDGNRSCMDSGAVFAGVYKIL